MVNLPPPQALQVASTPETAALARAEQTSMPVEELKQQLAQIQQLQKEVMVVGEDYGVIEGMGTKNEDGVMVGKDGKPVKPVLFNPGAEKLCMLFRIAPRYEPDMSYSADGKHLTVTTKCFLYGTAFGNLRGEGLGLCSSRESKYAWRRANRSCPRCSRETIFPSKRDGGWFCWATKGGCGAEFSGDDERIMSQRLDRVPNPDIEDTHNTVLKMSMKRAFVGATRTATAAGHLFTQDLGDSSPEDDNEDRGYGAAGDGDDRYENPRPYFERIEAAKDLVELEAVANDVHAAQLHPRDKQEVERAGTARQKKLRASSGASQRETMDRMREGQSR
jgi:hypothetical protein